MARLKFFHHEVRSRFDWTASADEADAGGAEGGRFAPGCPADVGMLGAGVNYAGPPSCCVVALARPIINKQATWVKPEVMYARESKSESRRSWTKSTTTHRGLGG